MSEPLPATVRGEGPERIVLLHGFGGSRRVWDDVLSHLNELPLLAPDLPGHGEACQRTDLSTVEARDAVIAEMDRNGIERAHLVGHSRGGAIACLVAMKIPDRTASLILLAPGGFGPEIAADALHELATARSREEARDALTSLFHPAEPTDADIEDERSAKALTAIHAGMIRNGAQGTLRLDPLEAAPFPVRVIWGEADAVLPASRAHAIKDAEIEIWPGLGHMLPAEVPARVADAIETQFRTNRHLAS